MAKSLPEFVDSIRQSGLVPSDLQDRIASWADVPGANPKTVARQIVQHGWLSSLQVKMIWNGRTDDLFFGQYVLVEKLGEGGMGEVFRAKHRRMGRDVALKVIRKERLDSPEAVRRFQREIQAAAQLSHENVVMAYDADQHGDIHFFAMELVEGVNLAKKVREEGPLQIADAANCIRQTALGLQHAMERGMVHRDIKPSNLFLSKNGIIKILDMGLARIHDADGEIQTRITQEGLVIGTPDFIAPEQARNSRTADIRSDIYSLGCSLYYLLTVESPYPEGTPTEKMLRHTTEPVPNIQSRRPDAPLALAAVLARMMAKNPDDRYQTPAEVAEAMAPFCVLPGTQVLHTPIVIPSHVPMAEPATDSNFRLQPNDGKLVLNRLYQHHEKTSNTVLYAILGAAAAIVAGAILWLVLK